MPYHARMAAALVQPPQASAAPIVVVCGARRTGTTLLAAVLSTGPNVPAFPGEAGLLVPWISSYRWALDHFESRALPFFDDRDALAAYFRNLLDQFHDHCRTRFSPASTVIFKSPELSLVFDDAYELMPDARFVVIARDPRDQVASEFAVTRRRLKQPADAEHAAGRRFASMISFARRVELHQIVKLRRFGALARRYVAYYAPILDHLRGRSDRILLVHYEDLVDDPARVVEQLEAFTGLDLSEYDPTRDWQSLGDSYWAYGVSADDTPHYGKSVERSRVGAYREAMSERQARRVQRVCAHTANALGYHT